jgi:DNA-binding SARP family transcriptional activator/tRNA A-37 threonylcarbamoyl transferase component Bud32
MIRVEALGGLRVLKDGEELQSLHAKRLRAAVLVYIAVERETSRGRLCQLFWPDSSPEDGRHSLSQMLYELRKDLGDEWVESVGERVTGTPELSVDVDRLEAAAASEASDVDIVEVYRGPFLDGVMLGGGAEFEHWAEGKRSALHAMAKRLLRSAVERERDADGKARLARAWVELDPLDDEAQHELIGSMARAGDRSGALEQFRVYSELIATQLEVEPLEQTLELIEQIKTGAVGPRDSKVHPAEREVEIDTSEREDAAPLDLGPGLIVSRLIGRGATGLVYLAREPALKRLVAVKMLDADMAKDPTARARFEREAQSAAKVVHPNVAAVHRVGTTEDGRPYLVMPYVKGGTLADRMKALGPLPPDEVRRLLAEAASALAAAHAVGVIHRDVRPGNFLYEEDTGRTYLADFGLAGVLESGTEEIARLTRTGELLGNAEYISPEQAAGEVSDRSDVYSLGVLGRALLFGPPLASVDASESADPVLVRILDRCTSPNPRHRPSARQIEEALNESRPSRGTRSESSAWRLLRRWWGGAR